ncbi:hypothetical protein [Marco virus]|uniref:Uncharacterized protein n=1 Tax=Marco virus TaxID=1158190 RepID=A0A0D3R1F9_9RHAB|nr:hypothetical protein [Marco virus]AJR28451.1 hypothetical protein [Marco virus]
MGSCCGKPSRRSHKIILPNVLDGHQFLTDESRIYLTPQDPPVSICSVIGHDISHNRNPSVYLNHYNKYYDNYQNRETIRYIDDSDDDVYDQLAATLK